MRPRRRQRTGAARRRCGGALNCAAKRLLRFAADLDRNVRRGSWCLAVVVALGTRRFRNRSGVNSFAREGVGAAQSDRSKSAIRSLWAALRRLLSSPGSRLTLRSRALSPQIHRSKDEVRAASAPRGHRKDKYTIRRHPPPGAGEAVASRAHVCSHIGNAPHAASLEPQIITGSWSSGK